MSETGQSNCPGAATASAASSGAHVGNATASSGAPDQQARDAELARLLNILGAISPIAVDWVKQNSRVPQTLSRRNGVITGTESTTF